MPENTASPKTPFIIEVANFNQISDYTFLPVPDRLGPLSRINIFIGPNNSGKSRLMRAVLSAVHQQFAIPSTDSTRELWQTRSQLEKLLLEEKQWQTNDSTKPILDNLQHFKTPLRFDSGRQYTNGSLENTYSAMHHWLQPRSPAFEITQLAMKFVSLERSTRLTPVSFKQIYVPTLRSFKSPKDSPKFFEQVAKEDYFSDARISNPTIECGGEMYSTLKQYLLGDRKSRNIIRAFEEFISSQFLDNVGLTLIPRESDNHVYVRIGNEQERPIPHVGDGIQQIVTILFKAFVDRTPAILCVEEPELFLHPGYQTRLMQCFEHENFSHIQVFATTHSNHLINLTLDRTLTSVFRFTKDCSEEGDEITPKFKVSFLSDSETEVLSEIGASRSGMLLTNCTILVEGPTDRRYFQRFLDIYIAEMNANGKKIARLFVPDLHYSFAEYGGANIVQWGFLEREHSIKFERIFGDNVLVVMDKDNSHNKEERFNQLRITLGDRVCRTEAIEVENLIGPPAIRKIVADYEGGDIGVLASIKESDYRTKRLGTFLESKILNSKRKSKDNHPYSDVPASGKGGGTIKDKGVFCDKAMRYVNSRSDMTSDAWNLAEKIYQFIEKHNK